MGTEQPGDVRESPELVKLRENCIAGIKNAVHMLNNVVQNWFEQYGVQKIIWSCSFVSPKDGRTFKYIDLSAVKQGNIPNAPEMRALEEELFPVNQRLRDWQIRYGATYNLRAPSILQKGDRFSVDDVIIHIHHDYEPRAKAAEEFLSTAEEQLITTHG